MYKHKETVEEQTQIFGGTGKWRKGYEELFIVYFLIFLFELCELPIKILN